MSRAEGREQVREGGVSRRVSRDAKVLEPDQLTLLGTVHTETLAVVAGRDGPYSRIDRDVLSLEVARVLMDAARQGTLDPGSLEQAVLRRLAERFHEPGKGPPACSVKFMQRKNMN